jgi:DNA mismatch endonuclease (patch repair protein)
MQANRSSDTRPEVALRSAVHRLGLRYRKHVPPITAERCRADLVFPRQRVAVFADGCFWHACPVHGVRPVTNCSYLDRKIGGNVERDRRNGERCPRCGDRREAVFYGDYAMCYCPTCQTDGNAAQGPAAVATTEIRE